MRTLTKEVTELCWKVFVAEELCNVCKDQADTVPLAAYHKGVYHGLLQALNALDLVDEYIFSQKR